MNTKDFPSIRDIFFEFDFTDFSTTRYAELNKQFTEKLKAAVPQFDKNDELDCLAVEGHIEAQAMGFEQGFAYAAKLFMQGGAQYE